MFLDCIFVRRMYGQDLIELGNTQQTTEPRTNGTENKLALWELCQFLLHHHQNADELAGYVLNFSEVEDNHPVVFKIDQAV